MLIKELDSLLNRLIARIVLIKDLLIKDLLYRIHCIIIIEKTLYILLNSSLSILYLTLVTGDFCCHKYQNNMCIRQKFWIWLKGKDMPINSKSSDGGSIYKALYRLGISHYEKLSDEVDCDKFISFRTLSSLPNLVLQDLNCMVSK